MKFFTPDNSCPMCGMILLNAALACYNCGAPIELDTQPPHRSTASPQPAPHPTRTTTRSLYEQEAVRKSGLKS
jgi:hypothetical protein